MKTKTLIRTLLLLFLLGRAGNAAVSVDWANSFGSTMVDSTNTALTSSSYSFQLGTFESFTPSASNYSSWQTNWRTFDESSYNEADGYFSSSADLDSSGFSNGTNATASYDFSNQDAYIWIYNTQAPVNNSSEWFLGRVNDWVFPDVTGGCCGGSFNTNFSLDDDFTTAAPGDVEVIWGSHSTYTYEGGGVYSVTGGGFLVQTYQLIPEPGTLIMAGVAFSVLGLSLIRRRKGGRV